jgi:hypothetical protein
MPVAGACRLCYHARTKHQVLEGSGVHCRVASCECNEYVRPRSARWREIRRSIAQAWAERDLATVPLADRMLVSTQGPLTGPPGAVEG